MTLGAANSPPLLQIKQYVSVYNSQTHQAKRICHVLFKDIKKIVKTLNSSWYFIIHFTQNACMEQLLSLYNVIKSCWGFTVVLECHGHFISGSQHWLFRNVYTFLPTVVFTTSRPRQEKNILERSFQSCDYTPATNCKASADNQRNKFAGKQTAARKSVGATVREWFH